MAFSKFYVLTPVEVQDESTGELVTIPENTDRDDVLSWDGSLAPPPGAYGGSTNADGEVYYAHVHAEQAAHDAIQADDHALLIGEMPDADVLPSALASAMNEKFRPQNLDQLKAQVGRALGRPDEFRDLDPDEWASRLGGGSGGFSE